MGRSWKERPNKSWGRDYKKQKHHKKEKAWNTKNQRHFEKEKYSPFDDTRNPWADPSFEEKHSGVSDDWN